MKLVGSQSQRKSLILNLRYYAALSKRQRAYGNKTRRGDPSLKNLWQSCRQAGPKCYTLYTFESCRCSQKMMGGVMSSGKCTAAIYYLPVQSHHQKTEFLPHWVLPFSCQINRCLLTFFLVSSKANLIISPKERMYNNVSKIIFGQF